MNYAALLAVLAVLAFAFPVFVRLAGRGGFPQAAAVGAALAGAILVLAWHLVRERVHRRRAILAKIERIQVQLEAEPDSPAAYIVGGEHLGDLLAALGRRREALTVYERSLALEGSDGRRRAALERRASRLRSSASA